MTLHRLALCLLLPACIIGVDDDDPECDGGKCDGVDQSCSDKRYGDGVCQTQLDCAVPDLDCFQTYDDDDAGVAWFAELEPRAAAREGRPARRVFGPEDPRFSKVRALLDRGWEAFKKHRPVGELADKRPALVFVEDDQVNAFVYPDDLDEKRASFAVMIHTKLLEIPTSDDANLGLMMHELQHAIGLHVVAGVSERLEVYYTSSSTNEPIGRRQVDDPDIREAVEVWRAQAREVGSYSNAELRGMPLEGALAPVFRAVFKAGIEANPTGCARSRDLVNTLVADIGRTTDPVSGAVRPDASIGPRVTATLAAVRDECVPGYPKSFVQVLAELHGVTPAQVEAQMAAADLALIAGKHVVDATALLADNRRTVMRAVEAAFQDRYGKPWSMVRFFSSEEDADDVTVPVLRAAGLDPTGLATFFVEVLMGAEESAACRAVLATGAVPPYGVDLIDTHHGDCWRTHHLRALAKEGATAPLAPRVLGPERPASTHPRLPIPARPPRLERY